MPERVAVGVLTTNCRIPHMRGDHARRLLDLPGTGRVHPGHGPGTTVAEERPHLESWATRGW
ncbi:hypothetical protein Nocox_22210 [Nonomuraea coxensis DSM 45129]|uniref:MBL fold metallo-hydrolase n=1 Tax=Nonomuraea coxensis DSM 45129 TaxID=1122611 RepID=A0ABX8U580_9ACTN|nr:hypothetical protein Nocox_22210 [Nonomuraea coxensis DSM 45129]